MINKRLISYCMFSDMRKRQMIEAIKNYIKGPPDHNKQKEKLVIKKEKPKKKD